MTRSLTNFAFALAVVSLMGCAADRVALSIDDSPGIVAGEVAHSALPWVRSVAGLAFKTQTGFEIFCTATVIEASTVLTAAHCLDDLGARTLYVVFGLDEAASDIQSRVATSSRVHGTYDAKSRSKFDRDDIALVRFSGSLPPGYRPMRLLFNEDILVEGAPVTVAGFGATNGNSHLGMGKLRFTEVTIRNPGYGISEVQTNETRSGTCRGDSGGPAMIEVDGAYVLWGITSRGALACNDDGIYTKVAAYENWIRRHLR